MLAFEATGIPTTYDESDVAALVGQQPRLLSDDELRTLLKGGLFLDGPAARTLCDRGFESLIGLESAEPCQPLAMHGAVSAEEHLHPDFDGAPRRYLTALLPNANYDARQCRLQPLPGASVISRMVNPDTEPLWPAMTAFENRLGGRVIVHGWTIGPASARPIMDISNRQMLAVARWLFRGRAPLIASGDGVWPLAFRKDCGTILSWGYSSYRWTPGPRPCSRFMTRDTPQKSSDSTHWPDGPIRESHAHVTDGVWCFAPEAQ